MANCRNLELYILKKLWQGEALKGNQAVSA